MTPEMINNIIEINKKKAPMSFEEYYNKKLLEECKYFIENPNFSIKYCMVMTHLKRNIREMALKEYKQKWPYTPIIQKKSNSTNTNNNVSDNTNDAVIDNSKESIIDNDELVICDKESVISEFDIIDEESYSEVDNVQQVSNTELRRSSRLKNKSN